MYIAGPYLLTTGLLLHQLLPEVPGPADEEDIQMEYSYD